MKLFVVVVSVAVVIMFVFATDAAAAPTDYEDTNDMMVGTECYINNIVEQTCSGSSLSAAIGGNNSPYVSVSSSDSGSSSKKSSKSPVYDLIKSVINLLTKMFSDSETTIPVGSAGVRQHRGMLA